MKTCDEVRLRLKDAKKYYRTPIIKAIGRANFSVEEVSFMVRVSEGTLYQILMDREEIWPELIADLSVVLDTSVGELFPEIGAQDV